MVRKSIYNPMKTWHLLINVLFFCIYRVYDFQSVITASSLVYGFALFTPIAIWFVFKQFDTTLQFVSIVCLYGYSLTIFIPAVVSIIIIYIYIYIVNIFILKCVFTTNALLIIFIYDMIFNLFYDLKSVFYYCFYYRCFV